MKRVLAMMVILLLTACRQQDLLINLNQQQANDVLAVLQRHNIQAEKKDEGKTGYTIIIGQSDFPAAVDLLKIYHLPGAADVEISDLFPADALVSSPRAEKARLFSAIEQRLEQSLRHMDGIATARVHVSYDIEAGENGKPAAPVHLSVLAVINQDKNPEILINDIKRFLLNTFSGVRYENISVVLSAQRELQQEMPSPVVTSGMPASGKFLIAGLILLTGLLIAGFSLGRQHLRRLIRHFPRWGMKS